MNPTENNTQPAVIVIPTALPPALVRVTNTTEDSNANNNQSIQRSPSHSSRTDESYSSTSIRSNAGESSPELSQHSESSTVRANRQTGSTVQNFDGMSTTSGRSPPRLGSSSGIHSTLPVNAIPIPASPSPGLSPVSTSRRHRLPAVERAHIPYLLDIEEDSSDEQEGPLHPKESQILGAHKQNPSLRDQHALNQTLALHAYHLDADAGRLSISLRSQSTIRHTRVDLGLAGKSCHTIKIWYSDPFDIEYSQPENAISSDRHLDARN